MPLCAALAFMPDLWANAAGLVTTEEFAFEPVPVSGDLSVIDLDSFNSVSQSVTGCLNQQQRAGHAEAAA